MSIYVWSAIVLISVNLASCRHHENAAKVPGDAQAAIRNFSDTTREQLYIEGQNDSTSVIVHGKHWYKPTDCPCTLAVFLDRRPITINQFSFQPDGSFSFHVEAGSIIMRHTLLVTQKKSETGQKQSQISFYTLAHEGVSQNH